MDSICKTYDIKNAHDILHDLSNSYKSWLADWEFSVNY